MEPQITHPRLNLPLLLLVTALVSGAGVGAYVAGGRVWRYLTAPPDLVGKKLPMYVVVEAKAPGERGAASVRFRGRAYPSPLVLDVSPVLGHEAQGFTCSIEAGPPFVIRVAGEPVELAAMPPVDSWTIQRCPLMLLPSSGALVLHYSVTPVGQPAGPRLDEAAIASLLRGPNIIQVFD